MKHRLKTFVFDTARCLRYNLNCFSINLFFLEGIMKEKKFKADLEWENRTLCVDESCIGVIGPDGRCKECGKPFESGQ